MAFGSLRYSLLLACLLSGARSVTAAAPVELSLSDAISRPVGPRGLQFSSAWQAQNGQFVQVTGHIVHQERARPGYFLLASAPVRMSEDADGDADDLPPTVLMVTLPPAQRDWIVHAPQHAVRLTGRLSIGRETLNGRVTWLRLALDSSALEHAPTLTPPPQP